MNGPTGADNSVSAVNVGGTGSNTRTVAGLNPGGATIFGQFRDFLLRNIYLLGVLRLWRLTKARLTKGFTSAIGISRKGWGDHGYNVGVGVRGAGTGHTVGIARGREGASKEDGERAQ